MNVCTCLTFDQFQMMHHNTFHGILEFSNDALFVEFWHFHWGICIWVGQLWVEPFHITLTRGSLGIYDSHILNMSCIHLRHSGVVSAARSIASKDNDGLPTGCKIRQMLSWHVAKDTRRGLVQWASFKLQRGWLDENLSFCQENVMSEKIGFLLGGHNSRKRLNFCEKGVWMKNLKLFCLKP